jgi:hypothetical protein
MSLPGEKWVVAPAVHGSVGIFETVTVKTFHEEQVT